MGDIIYRRPLIFTPQPPLPLGYPCSVIPEQREVRDELHCADTTTCTEEDNVNRYSRLDGVCNNLKAPDWGATGTDFHHLVEKRKYGLHFYWFLICCQKQ